MNVYIINLYYQATTTTSSCCSDSNVQTHYEVKDILHRLQQDLSVVDIDVEFSFDDVVDQHACLDIGVTGLTVPVGFEGNGHTVPSVWIDVSQSLTNYLDDSLGQHMGLYLEYWDKSISNKGCITNLSINNTF